MKAAGKYILIVALAAGLGLVVYFKVFVPKHTFTTIHPSSGRLNGPYRVSVM